MAHHIVDYSSIVEKLRNNYNTRQTHTYEWRVHQLNQLEKMFTENRTEWCEALQSDLKQNLFIMTIEINMILEEIKYMRNNLKRLMETRLERPTKIGTFPSRIETKAVPKGVVLIISPWNMPVCLQGKPLVAAIAAGNAVVIKPSEISASVSAVYARLVPRYLDEDFIACVEGGPQETTELLKCKFDHIFYTGSTTVGKIIMKAAAEHLASVTLELGGKCPCLIDKSVMKDDKLIQMTAERIFWGKSALCGQACLGVDYCLIEEQFADVFISRFIKCVEEFLGKTVEQRQKSTDYSRVVNERHMKRITSLLDPVRDCVVFGGTVDHSDRFIDMTVVKNPPADSQIMQDEIFGPILVVKTVRSMREAVDIVNAKPHPLSLYIFSKDEDMILRVRDETTSGGIAVNDCIVQYSEHNYKFGGIGNSGQGCMNGDQSFDTFSQQRSTLINLSVARPQFRFPPYTEADADKLTKAATGRLTNDFIFPVMFFFVYWFVRLFGKKH